MADKIVPPLFPVFEVPAVLTEKKQKVNKYARAPLWNFETGDFDPEGTPRPVYGSGYDAWVFWCKKTLMTQRWAHSAYSGNAGVEIEEAFNTPDRKAIESSLEQTITEALLADPMGRTRQVRNFNFDWYGDSLSLTCEIVGSDGNSAAIDTSLKI